MRSVSSQLLSKLQAGELVCFTLIDMIIDGETFRYTDCDIPLALDDHTYVPVPIEPSNIVNMSGQMVSSFSFKIASNVEYDGSVSAYKYLKDVFIHGSPVGSTILARLVFLNTNYYAVHAVNLLTNSGFESGVMGDWNLDVASDCNASASIQGSGAYKGTYCAKITIVDGWGDSAHVPHPQDILFQQQLSCDINAGYLYDLSFAAKAAAERKIAVDVGPPEGSEHPMFYNIDLTTDWQFFNLQFIAPTDIAESELPNVNFYLARSNSDDDVYIDHVRFSNNLYPITLFKGYIDNFNLKLSDWININVVDALATWNRKTSRKQSSLCRWTKFSGEECRYDGSETWCDRTYARCQDLSNTAHFGGERFLPSLMNKVLYWGRIPDKTGLVMWNDGNWYTYDRSWIEKAQRSF